jgi:muramoyltetrapeptide carboxypeptidase
MSNVVPPPLKPGDTIAIIPTARAISVEELRDGIALAESWGLKVRLGDGIGRKHFQQAGTAEERAADLQAALNDPKVRAIWCARGGYGTVHLLDHLDLSALRRDPKWIVGFSDITVLHNALHNIGIASLHAQMPFNSGAKTEESRETIRKALFGEEWRMMSNEWRVASEEGLFACLVGFTSQTRHSPLATQREGTCEGILIGGNLSLLYALRGTPYDIDPRGKILFIEDLDELLYHMDRMVQNLRLAGWFKDLAGLIVGGMSDMRDKNPEDPFGKSAEQIIADALGDTSYPVCFGFPAGHIDDNRALVFGQKAKLSVTTSGATLSFEGSV